MCMIAESIRLGAKWHPIAKVLQATRATNLAAVKKISIQFDPFAKNTQAIRSAWYALTSRKVRETNPKCIVDVNVVNDRSDPRMHVDLSDGRHLLFKCAHLSDTQILNYLMHLAPPPADKKKT